MATLITPPLIDAVCERALRLPCSPEILPSLASVLQRDDSSAEEVETIIQMDPPLAAATLRLANSAFFGGKRVGTVTDAVLRLGQREIYKLAALVLIERWDHVIPAELSWEPGDFCRHALCTGLAAEALADQTGKVDPESAYTGGLLCDLGKLAMAHSCAKFYPVIRSHCHDSRVSWEEAETEVLGYNHTMVGGRLLCAWRFPLELSAASEFQSKPRTAPEHLWPLLAHLHAAKYIATSIGVGVVEDGFLFSLDGSFLEECGFTADLLEEVMPMVLDRASARLGQKLTHGPIAFGEN